MDPLQMPPSGSRAHQEWNKFHEARFRGVFENAPLGICVNGPEGLILQANAAFCRMLGYSQEELLDTAWADLTHPDDLGLAQLRKEQLWAGYVEFVDAEARFLHRTGAVVLVHIRVSLVRDSGGSPIYAVLHAEDIAERRKAENAMRDAQNLAQSTIDALSSHVCVLDETGTILAVNQAWTDFAEANQLPVGSDDVGFGSPACFGVGANYFEACARAVGPDASEAAKFAAGIRTVMHGKGEQFALEYSCHSSDKKRWFIGRVTRFSINRLTRILIEHINITERKLAEQVLQSSEETFRRLTDNIHEVFWMMNPAATEMIYVSPAYEHIWGETTEGLYANPQSWMNSIHPEDRARAEQLFWRQVRGEILENEYRIVQSSGAIRWIRNCAFPVHQSDGDISRITGVAEDITERKMAEFRLVHQALYDELTDLPNRKLFREKLEQAIAASKAGNSGAVFFIDLDQFKLVNDTLGHAGGDHLLKQVVARLLAVCGEFGTLSRFGGDEFTFVATGFEDREAVRHFGEKLIKCLDEPVGIAGRELFIGASIGISLFPENGTDPDVLKRDADMAMHEAKRAGRNQLRFFTPELWDATNERLEMDSRLRRALAFSEFELQFQPQFAPGRSCPTRFEALIRWFPLNAQPVAPLKFIPVAEQNGLIVPIGTWVLGEACRRCVAWQTGELRGAGVAVNVSAHQFGRPDFVEIVMQALQSTGLPPHLLELELTESVFIQDVEESAFTMTKLRNLNVTIALDDFGTGYSSLSYLQTLPFDALKIDRSFLTGTVNRPSGAAVLRCVVELAHTLGLRVVAEGVETSDQLDLLCSLGCDEFQGFLLGRPSSDVAGFHGLFPIVDGVSCHDLLELSHSLTSEEMRPEYPSKQGVGDQSWRQPIQTSRLRERTV